MGVYSEFILGVQLKPDIPEEMLKIIRYLTGQNGYYGFPDDFVAPAHPFFRTERGESIFSYARNSFDSIPGSKITFDDYSKGYVLTVRAHLKDYDLEYFYFLDWIMPYILTGYNKVTFVGYVYREDLSTPTLIYCFKGEVWISEVIAYTKKGYTVDIYDEEEFVPDGSPNQLEVKPFILLQDYIAECLNS